MVQSVLDPAFINIYHLTVYSLIHLQNLRRKWCNVLWFWKNSNYRKFGWAIERGRNKFRRNQDIFVNRSFFIIFSPFKPKQVALFFPWFFLCADIPSWLNFLPSQVIAVLFCMFLKLSWLKNIWIAHCSPYSGIETSLVFLVPYPLFHPSSAAFQFSKFSLPLLFPILISFSSKWLLKMG